MQDAAGDPLVRPEFIYVLQVTRLGMLTEGPTADEAAIVSRHFNYLAQLTEQGVVLLAGRMLTNDERTRGYVVFRADDETAARSIMSADPCIAEGVMTAELYPFKVALWHSAYSV